MSTSPLWSCSTTSCFSPPPPLPLLQPASPRPQLLPVLRLVLETKRLQMAFWFKEEHKADQGGIYLDTSLQNFVIFFAITIKYYMGTARLLYFNKTQFS